MSPSPGLKVEIAALRTDAKAWDQAADDMSDPRNAVVPLTLNGANDVMGLGSRMGIDVTYETARSKAEELMGQAAGYFIELATALTDTAAYYEAQEQARASEFAQLTANDVEGN